MSNDDKRGNAASTPSASLGSADARADQAAERELTPGEGAEAIRLMFEEGRKEREAAAADLAAADRAAFDQVHEETMQLRTAARDGGLGFFDGQMRTLAALRVIADTDPDDDITDVAIDARDQQLRLLSTMPALVGRDLTRKLAALVSEILTLSTIPDLPVLTLAASALVDAVTLESGPIILPPHPRAGDRAADTLGSAEA